MCVCVFTRVRLCMFVVEALMNTWGRDAKTYQTLQFFSDVDDLSVPTIKLDVNTATGVRPIHRGEHSIMCIVSVA